MKKQRRPLNKKRRLSSRLFFVRRKVSPLNKMESIPFKDVEILKDYISDRGRIIPRRITGTDAKTQRSLKLAIKRARHIALFSFSDGYLPQITASPTTETHRYKQHPFNERTPNERTPFNERTPNERTSERTPFNERTPANPPPDSVSDAAISTVSASTVSASTEEPDIKKSARRSEFTSP